MPVTAAIAPVAARNIVQTLHTRRNHPLTEVRRIGTSIGTSLACSIQPPSVLAHSIAIRSSGEIPILCAGSSLTCEIIYE
jgi:hypothetical protein